MRTDGTLLEEILILDNYMNYISDEAERNFVVYKDRIYYTENEETRVSASTYAYKNMLMSCALDGTDTRCDFVSEQEYNKNFYIECYYPKGSLFLDCDGDIMVYSLEDSNWFNLELESASNRITVGWDSTIYYDYSKSSYGDSLIGYLTDASEGKAFRCNRFFNADDMGVYFDAAPIYYDSPGIGYFEYKTESASLVSPDDAMYCFLPGDGHLYYTQAVPWDRDNPWEWYRIASVNGSRGEGTWELIDWMTPPILGAMSGEEIFE
jgi:hypothetical protein